MQETLRKKPLMVLLIMVAMVGLGVNHALSHCQVPCGIYDDHARVHMMLEDAVTVEKAASMITSLAGKSDVQSQHQMVRWVMNKELHAQKIITTIADYFLTQRVKMSQEDYVERLKKHHAVIVDAMKAKQHADVSAAQALKKSIEALSVYYPAGK